ncbi:MAG: hypothetical protein ACM3QU_10245 [Verrucomicrobiota bacterium]
MAEDGSGALGLPGHERTVRSYFDAFSPAPDWADLTSWPPDVFALANLVLDHTEAYRFVVAPPPRRTWPPLPTWGAEVQAAAGAWRVSVGSGAKPPEFVGRLWRTVTRLRDVRLADVRSGAAWSLVTALLTLHAIADETCAEVVLRQDSAPSSFEAQAWELLQGRGSLSRLSPVRVRIVPKAHLSARGITIRSLSRHLALCYESVAVRWRAAGRSGAADRSDYRVVLLPWPLAVEADDFRPVPPMSLGNMDSDLFGFFEFAPAKGFDCRVLESLLADATGSADVVDAVVLPEAALSPDAVDEVEQVLAAHDVSFLIAGVACRPSADGPGRNYLHFGIRGDGGWAHYEQDKHHRWALDERQIRQYHLTRSLDVKKLWWEAIDIRERTLHVIEMGGGMTTTPLVCEDLARLDEVADLVRRIGPSLVVAVLLDGPQLATRWPCRYASVIADDPGSAVLTLTSIGMAERSLPPGRPPSRVVAHWNNPEEGATEIELAPGAAGVLISMTVEGSTLWTADGRRHQDVPRLKLVGLRQLRPGRTDSLEARHDRAAGRRRSATRGAATREM